jgi:hypothetical protein
MFNVRFVLLDERLDPAGGMCAWLDVLILRGELDVLDDSAVVRDVGQDGIDSGVSVLGCDIFGGSAHLDKGLKQNLHPRVDCGAKCLC